MGQRAHRLQDVGGRQGGRRAGRARRHAEPVLVELARQRLALDVEHRERDDVGEPVDRVAHHVDVGHLGRHPAPDQVHEATLADSHLRALRDDRLQRGGSGQHARDVLEPRRARVDAVVDRERGSPTSPGAHQQHPDARRAAPLVRRRRRGGPAIGLSGLRGVEPAGRRAGVDEQRHVVLPGEGSHVVEGLDGADLRVGRLHRDDAGAGDEAGQLVEADPAQRVDAGSVRRTGGEGLPPPGGREDRGVLDGGVHEAGAHPTTALEQAEQPLVDRGRARRGEGDLAGPRAEQRRGHLAGVVEQEAGVAAVPVQPRGVGPALVDGGQEGVPCGRMQRLRGGAVEVATDRVNPPVRSNRHTGETTADLRTNHGSLSSRVRC